MMQRTVALACEDIILPAVWVITELQKINQIDPWPFNHMRKQL
jgi:hypothetical protein